MPYWVRTTLFEGPETLDPVKYRYTGPYNGLQAEHVEDALRIFELQEPTAGKLILDHPNLHWTRDARTALYG